MATTPTAEPVQFDLPVIDGFELEERYRLLLRPDELMPDATGELRRLPRFFLEVDSWQTALTTQLTEHFTLSEFMVVDVREAPALRDFPRHIPCAVTLLAAQLEMFRREAGAPVYISANGGYRTPAHALSDYGSTHCWATAANIYRIGDEYLDTRERIEKYGRIASRAMPGCWVRPYGNVKGYADDHLHIDIGYVVQIPHGTPGERAQDL